MHRWERCPADSASGRLWPRPCCARRSFLLLDEPTNHLDSESIIWLEDYLRAFRGSLVMVTHDRYFLERVCNRIVEVNRGKLYCYEASIPVISP